MKIKPSRNGEITLLFTDKHVGALVLIFNVASMFLNSAIRENKVLANVSIRSRVCAIYRTPLG